MADLKKKPEQNKRPEEKSAEQERIRKRAEQARQVYEARERTRTGVYDDRLHKVSELPENFPDRFNLVEGRHPRDKPFEREGRLFMTSAETDVVRWIDRKDVPDGHSALHDHWVYKKGSQIEMRPRYPETPEGLRREWRRENHPLVDRLGRPTGLDEREMRQRSETNRRLNQRVDYYVNTNKDQPLGDALKKARQDSNKELQRALIVF
jgi:hypothetical protein